MFKLYSWGNMIQKRYWNSELIEMFRRVRGARIYINMCIYVCVTCFYLVFNRECLAGRFSGIWTTQTA